MSDLWAHLFELVGALFELTGGLYLANRYLKVRRRQIPGTLVSVLWQGPAALDAARFGATTEERAFDSLKGICLVIVGFAVRSVPHLVFLGEYLLRH